MDRSRAEKVKEGKVRKQRREISQTHTHTQKHNCADLIQAGGESPER